MKRFRNLTVKKTNRVVFLFILLPAWSAFCSDERIREFFEWGEYDSLLVAVNDYFDQRRDTADSAEACKNRGYAGVACFAKGDIAGARQQFRLALACQNDLPLDEQYVTPEMSNLFAATRNELEQERIRAHREDSLRTESERERRHEEERRRKEEAKRREEEKRRQAVALRASALTSRFWKNTGTAAGLFSLCAAMSVLAEREYSSGKIEYSKFTSAAQTGDKARYDHYRTTLLKKNRFITGYAAIAGLAGGAGAYCTWRAVHAQRLKLHLQKTGEGYGVAAAIDF